MNVTEILGDLIRFNTVSSRSNLSLIQYVQDFLAGHGIKSTRIPSPDGTKANLFATIGPGDRGGVVLSGHTDVVPAEGDQWRSAPFELTYSNQRLYGRGTCDMKGFLACCLATIPEMVRFPLKTPIHLAFSYDEEVGCLGIRGMIDQFGKTLPMPRIVWVGEPTQMKPIVGHKSIASARYDIQGHACHSSLPSSGVSAIETAHKMMGYVYSLRKRFESIQDNRFTPPITSIHIGLLHGGTAANIIARHCNFTIDIRGNPGVNPADILGEIDAWSQTECLPEMQNRFPECKIRQSIEASVPAFESPDNNPATLFAHRILTTNDRHYAPYVTEAGLFQNAGIPTVVCGPGSVEQAHKIDEWIDPAELQRALYTLRCITEHCRND